MKLINSPEFFDYELSECNLLIYYSSSDWSNCSEQIDLFLMNLLNETKLKTVPQRIILISCFNLSKSIRSNSVQVDDAGFNYLSRLAKIYHCDLVWTKTTMMMMDDESNKSHLIQRHSHQEFRSHFYDIIGSDSKSILYKKPIVKSEQSDLNKFQHNFGSALFGNLRMPKLGFFVLDPLNSSSKGGFFKLSV